MPEMKTLNGYEIVDAKARQDIADLQEKIELVDDSYFLDCSNAPQFANPAPATAVMIEFVEQLMAGKDVCAQIKDSYDDAFYPALININQSSQVFTVYLQKATGGLHLLQENDTWEWDTICLQHDGTECVYFKGGKNSYEFVSKEYVDQAVKDSLHALEERIAALEGK